MADNILNFKKGDVICEEGKYEVWFYEILSGSMTIYKDYGLSSQQEIGTADSGYIGEMGFINSLPRVGTVVADGDVSLAKIDEASFNSYFAEHPEKIYSIIQCLASRLSEIDVNSKEVMNTVEDCIDLYESKNTPTAQLKNAMKKFSDIFKKRKA
ncbi:MAG: cyclic nucleotide-binding domain-containing protein [Lachnospiraceae bacterium]|nr:cyclic nucleotide-binding domain-containing protein [Lachnospiraceae bacterium]